MSTESQPLDVEQPLDRSPSAATPAHRNDAPADRFMRRLLRLPVDGPRATAADAQKAFQTSIIVATFRCLLMYIVFPFVLPALGLASDVGPAIGLVISVAAIVAICMSIRRFFRADHSKRWHYTVLGTTVIGFMIVLIVQDLAELLG